MDKIEKKKFHLHLCQSDKGVRGTVVNRVQSR